MGTGAGAEQVVGVVDVGQPVAQRLVHRLLQRRTAEVHRFDPGTEQRHAPHVALLASHVFGPHVDDALQPEQRADGGGGHTVLAGTGLGDDAPFTHAPCQQDLADAVVDLVGAGVVQILALEIEAGSAELLGQPFGQVQRAGAADIVAQQGAVLLPEAVVSTGGGERLLQRLQRRHQGLRHVAAAVAAKLSHCIRALSQIDLRRHALLLVL